MTDYNSHVNEMLGDKSPRGETVGPQTEGGRQYGHPDKGSEDHRRQQAEACRIAARSGLIAVRMMDQPQGTDAGDLHAQ